MHSIDIFIIPPLYIHISQGNGKAHFVNFMEKRINKNYYFYFYYDFLLLTKNKRVRLISNFNSSLGVNENVKSCLSCVSLCGPVMDL